MRSKHFKVLLLAIFAMLAIMNLGEKRSINAGIVYCTDEVGVSDTDTLCGSLVEKMADDYGIEFGEIIPDTNQTLSVNFKKWGHRPFISHYSCGFDSQSVD